MCPGIISKRELFKFKLQDFLGRLVDPYERLKHKCFKAYQDNKMDKFKKLAIKRQLKFPKESKEDDEAADKFEKMVNNVTESLGPNATHEEICAELKKRYFPNAKDLKLEGEA